MAAYDWPGNVRELENLIERLVVLSDGTTISNEDLPPEISRSKSRFSDVIREHTANFEADFISRVTSRASLNDRQVKALEFVKTEGRITKQNYIKLTNATKTTAFRDLASLVKLHLLSQRGVGKSSTTRSLNKSS